MRRTACRVSLACLLVVVTSGLPMLAQATPAEWSRLAKVRPGQVLDVTTSDSRRITGVFIAAEPDRLILVDVSDIADKKVRRSFANDVRETRGLAESAPLMQSHNHRARVVRIPTAEVQQITTTKTSSSTGLVALATGAATVAGLFLGAYAAWASSKTLSDSGGTGTFFLVATAVPVAAGLATHAATRRTTTEVVYEAPLPTPLNEAEWQAVRDALPPSLRGK